MILSGYNENKVLIHDSKRISKFYYSDQLENKLGKNYIRCYSGNEKCNLLRFNIYDYLNSFDEIPKYIMYYLCGNAEAVVEIREMLIGKDIPFQQIVSEIYF